jgi:uncharacterized protein YbcI
MRDYLVAGIETSTGRKVLSFISDRDAENEHAAEVFVLDGPPRRRRWRQAAKNVLR